jgi:crotonobetainyl-CoA:carnitine CoA-transferase CaiB-like acyl-CoA transferase
MAQPFESVRVLEVGGTVAAAGATKTLSDYGATVTKLEGSSGGALRRMAPFPGDIPHLDRGAFHLALDTGKRSAVVDTRTPSGLEVLTALARGTDLAFVHLAAAEAEPVLAVLRNLGDDGPTTVALSVHGLDGPFALRTENDLSLFAWSNRMLRHSFDDEEPLRYSSQVATMQWAATATAVASAAVWGRRRDGIRRDNEVAGVEALAGSVDSHFVQWVFSGAEVPRPAGPSKTAYPAGAFACSDGYVLFAAANEPFFSRLCSGIGHPELSKDPRFTDAAQKPLHHGEFMAVLDAYLAARTRQQVFTELQSHGVMVAPLLDVNEAFEDEQAVARSSFVTVEQPGVGAHTIPGAPFRIEGAWSARPAPTLGEHTFEVLREAGFSLDECQALFRAGVVG